MLKAGQDDSKPATIDAWLADIDLEHYADCFKRADIDLDILPHLKDPDLKEIGIASLGHRRKILAHLPNRRSLRPEAPTAERRYLTILFCDLVDSTRWAERLGAEDFRDLLASYYAAVGEAVAPIGGYVAQYHGDGVLVYFGYPIALEDAALRGVLAARQVIASIGKRSNRGGTRLAARIGVASGLVVIDRLATGGESAIGRAFGATVNLAARLQAAAQPGSVVVSEATAALVRHHFHLRPRGIHRLKGVENPCAVFEVEGQQTGELRAVATARPVRVPFVGRAEELARLSSIWSRVEAGASEAVLLFGEPGIGKSRLVSEFLATVEHLGYRVRRIPCQPLRQDMPFHAFLNAVEVEEEEHREGASEVHDALRQVGGETQAERRRRRSAAIDALVRYFTDGDRPRVVWCDDIHWADPSSAEVILRLMTARVPSLLVIISGRSLPPGTGSQFEIPKEIQSVSLTSLAADEVRQIIAHLLAESEPSQALVAMLADRSEGVPLFAEELSLETREGMASGRLGDPRHIVPTSLQQSLEARVGRLTAARPLMRLVSCLGRSVPVSLLRDLWAADGPIEEALEEITAAGLVELQLTRSEGGENLLVCRHQLILDCAYEMILKRDRIVIHGKIADALRRRSSLGIPVHPLIQAEHLERAERLQEAAELYAEAGRQTAAQSADAEAVSLYRRALALARRQGDSAGDASLQFEADTLLGLYPVMVGAHGYSAASADVTARLKELIPRLGGTERLFSSVFLRWLDLACKGEIDTAHRFTRNVSRLLAPGKESLHALMIHRMLGSTHMFRGEFEAARNHLQRFLNNYKADVHALGLRQFGATDNYVTVLCCFAAMAAFGDLGNEARQARDQAITAAEARGHVHTLCHTLCFGAALPAGFCRDWGEVATLQARLSTIATERSLFFWQCFARMLEGIVIAADGDAVNGRRVFEKGHEPLLAQGFLFMGPTFRLVLALACNGAIADDELTRLRNDLAAGERWGLSLLAALKTGDSTPSASR